MQPPFYLPPLKVLQLNLNLQTTQSFSALELQDQSSQVEQCSPNHLICKQLLQLVVRCFSSSSNPMSQYRASLLTVQKSNQFPLKRYQSPQTREVASNLNCFPNLPLQMFRNLNLVSYLTKAQLLQPPQLPCQQVKRKNLLFFFSVFLILSIFCLL